MRVTVNRKEGKMPAQVGHGANVAWEGVAGMGSGGVSEIADGEDARAEEASVRDDYRGGLGESIAWLRTTLAAAALAEVPTYGLRQVCEMLETAERLKAMEEISDQAAQATQAAVGYPAGLVGGTILAPHAPPVHPGYLGGQGGGGN